MASRSDKPSRGLANRVAHFLSEAGPKLLKDLISLALGQFTSMAIGFVAFSYLARRLSVEDYGMLEFTVSLAAFAAIVIECGVSMIAVREMARSGADASRIAAAAVAARATTALIVAPIMILGGMIANLPETAKTLLFLYGISLCLGPFKQEWLLQSRERMQLAALGQPLRGGAFALVVFLCVGSSADLIWVGISELIAVAAVSTYYLSAQRFLGVSFDWRGVGRRIGYYLREGLAIGLSNGLWAFMLYVPMFLLVALADVPEDSAWLGAAQRLVIALVTASFLYHFNIYPVITRTVVHDRDRWQEIVRASVHVVAWGACGLALLLALSAAEIMAFVFGARFADAGPVFATLIWIFPLRFLTGHARWSLVAHGQQKWLLGAEITGASALVVTAFFAVPQLGAVGAALALIVGIATSGIVTQIRAERSLGAFGLAARVCPPLCLAMGVLVIADMLSLNTLTAIALAVGVYGTGIAVQARKLRADFRIVSYAKAA